MHDHVAHRYNLLLLLWIHAYQQTVANDAGRKPVIVTGNNIELTSALKDYVTKKLDKVLDKLGSVVTKVSNMLA